MADTETLYDLVLLLSTSGEEDQRAQTIAAVERMISDGGGRIERNNDWGIRGLAYRIGHQPDAEYHLLQFHAPAPVLEALSQSLRIRDGVMRFRIIKVRPGTPPAPETPPPMVASAASASAVSDE